MSCKELIESLRKTAEDKVRALRQDAETSAAAMAAETERALEDFRHDLERRRVSVGREKMAQADTEAQKKARSIILEAEMEMSLRLYDTARNSLTALRTTEYESIFARLVRELSGSWKTVRVNPADERLAGRYFPDAEIIPDTEITGGMDVSSADGRVRIINTFEKRLERAWSELLPGFIRDLHLEVSDETPEGNGGQGIPERVSPVKNQSEAITADC